MRRTSAAVERRLVARLGAVAGTPPELALVLSGRALRRTGAVGHLLRSVAFLVTTRPGAERLPAIVRLRGVGALTTAMLQEPADLLDYLGCEPGRGACGGLLTP